MKRARLIALAILSSATSCEPGAPPGHADRPPPSLEAQPVQRGPIRLTTSTSAGFARDAQSVVAKGPHLTVQTAGTDLSLRLGASGFVLHESIEAQTSWGPWSLVSDHLERQTDVARAEVRFRGDAIEEAWRFDRAPSGSVTIELTLEGGRFVRGDARGLLFAGARSELLRFGHGTWIDARGDRTEIEARFVDGKIALHVPAHLIARSTYPAVLDPVISPELMVDPSGPSIFGGARSAHVAFGGGTYFATWTDDRSMLGGGTTQVGVFVGTDGVASSRAGFPIPAASAVAFDGTQLVVAGASTVSSGGVFTHELRVARVASSGGTPDPSGVRVASAPSASGFNAVSLAGSPTGTLAAWTTASDAQVRYARIGSDGKVRDVDGLVLTGTSASTLLPMWNGAAWLIAWQAGSDIRAMRVGTDGTPIDTASKLIATASGASQIVAAFGGGSGMLVYATLSGIVALPIGADGSPTASPRTIDPGFTNNLGLAWDGGGFRVVWSDGASSADVHGMRLRADGTTLAAATLLASAASTQSLSTIACSSTECLFSWDDARNDTIAGVWGEVYAGRVKPDGSLPDTLSGKKLSNSAIRETAPLGVFVGSQLVVEWTDYRAGGFNTESRVRVLNADGTFAAASFPIFSNAFVKSLATDGSKAMTIQANVASDSSTHLFSERVAPATSTVVDVGGIDLGVAPTGVAGGGAALAWNGTEYLVAYQTSAGVSAIRVGSDGRAIGSAIPIDTGKAPSVASDGVDFMVTTSAAYSAGVNVTRVSAAGVASTGKPLSTATGGHTDGHIAYGGGTYLAVWTDGRDTTHTEIWGARVDAGGAVGGEFQITKSTTSKTSPRVVWDGSAFLLAYAEGDFSSSDIRATFIGADGRILGPTLAVTSDILLRNSPNAVAADGAGHRAVVWSAISFGELGGEEAFVATLTGAENGRACTSATSCASGFCVDGVCCGSACTDICAACDVIGSKGACVAIGDKTPHGARGPCDGAGAGTACGKVCDGTTTASCTYPPAGTISCGTASCSGGLETHVSSCDGAGACGDTAKPCGAYTCSGTSCTTSCTSSAQCSATSHCDTTTSTCQSNKKDGDGCAADPECASGHCVGPSGSGVCCSTACAAGATCGHGSDPTKWVCARAKGASCATGDLCPTGSFCVDGYCCDSTCNGQCEACDVAGSLGTCTPVRGDPHGSLRPACGGSSDECGLRACDGADRNTCAGFKYDATHVCKEPSCDATGSFTSASTCNGKGSCVAPPPSPCGGRACTTPGGCAIGACHADTDCAKDFRCEGGACTKAEGKCSSDHQSSTSSGTAKACSPYVCVDATGLCGNACSTGNECASGFSCDPGTKQCVNAPAAATDSSGGGCSASAAGASGSAMPALALLSMFALGRRRRRMREGARRSR